MRLTHASATTTEVNAAIPAGVQLGGRHHCCSDPRSPRWWRTITVCALSLSTAVVPAAEQAHLPTARRPHTATGVATAQIIQDKRPQRIDPLCALLRHADHILRVHPTLGHGEWPPSRSRRRPRRRRRRDAPGASRRVMSGVLAADGDSNHCSRCSQDAFVVVAVWLEFRSRVPQPSHNGDDPLVPTTRSGSCSGASCSRLAADCEVITINCNSVCKELGVRVHD
jgi:hypothetical protein